VALAAQRLQRARRERRRRWDGREAKQLLVGVAAPMLRERGELPEQTLGGARLLRPGQLGDLGAQRLDLADRDLVTSLVHDPVADTTGVGGTNAGGSGPPIPDGCCSVDGDIRRQR
jgi:hypothetical protein